MRGVSAGASASIVSAAGLYQQFACITFAIAGHGSLLLADCAVSEVNKRTWLLSGRPLQDWWMGIAAKMEQRRASGGLQEPAACIWCICNDCMAIGLYAPAPGPCLCLCVHCLSSSSRSRGPASAFCTGLLPYRLRPCVLPCAVSCPNSKKLQCCAAGEDCQWTFDKTAFAWERTCCKTGGWTGAAAELQCCAPPHPCADSFWHAALRWLAVLWLRACRYAHCPGC